MKKYIFKTIIFIAVIFIYLFIMAALGPEIAIQNSLMQMEDTYSSMTVPLWYNFLSSYQWAFFMVFALMVFYSEIKTNFIKFINFLKEKTNEKN